MRQGLAAVLLCVLVAGAGCSAIPGTGGGDGTATANEIPGIQDGQLQNESALLDAHVDAVVESGFSSTIEINITNARGGETFPVTQEQRTGVAAGGTEYSYQVITTGQRSTRVIVWGNESIQVLRAETGGGNPQYQSGDPTPAGTLAGRVALEKRLSSDFEVTNVEQREDAPDIVTLETDTLPENNTVFENQSQIENVRDFNAELVVDTEGRIHSYNAVAVYDIEGETADYEWTFQMTSFEDPGVEKPDWVDEAAG